MSGEHAERSGERLAPAHLYPEGALSPPFGMIDVRSPIEWSRGALPGAHPLPLMSDEERREVGIRYAEVGQEAAVELGWELVGPHLEERIAAWRRVADQGPTAVICWRGGMRSALASELIARPRTLPVAGGYKAVRRHLMQALPAALERAPLLVVSGLTGSGKTELLRSLAGASDVLEVIDLEAIAAHRGSSFGAVTGPQPPQPTFEHEIACALRLHRAGLVVVEDESRYVGRRTLPDALLEAMRKAPLALLEVPNGERVQRVFREYVKEPAQRDGIAATRQALEAATLRLRRRLGGPRTREVLSALERAEAAWFDLEAHRAWILLLLEQYYDRLYERNRVALGRDVVLRGDVQELTERLPELAAERGRRPR